MARLPLHGNSSGSGSSDRSSGRRRQPRGFSLASAALVSAAAALLALPEPAQAFLPAGVANPASAAGACGLRRPRQPVGGSGWGATTMHNSEAFGNGSGNNSPSSSSPADQPDDLQHKLFKDDARRVILFDGDCGFCSEGVNLFLNFDGDPRGSFRFASLQGEIGQELLRLNKMDQKVFNTIVLVDADRIYTKSDAVLEIADRLRDPFPALAVLAKLLPHEARDWCYELVSRYRHMFGEKDSCRIPSESEMDRFLD